MPPRSDLPRLNKHFNVKHVDHDLGQGGASDEDIYMLAVSQKRVILTHNIKHFLSLAGTRDDAGIIGISANLTPSQVDTKLMALLTKSTPHALQGKFISLTGETET